MNIFKIGSLVLLMCLQNHAHTSDHEENLFASHTVTPLNKAIDAFTENYTTFEGMLSNFRRTNSGHDYTDRIDLTNEINENFKIFTQFYINSPQNIGFSIIFEVEHILYHIINYKPHFSLDKDGTIDCEYKFELEDNQAVRSKPYFYLTEDKEIKFITMYDHSPRKNKYTEMFIYQDSRDESRTYDLLLSYCAVVKNILDKIADGRNNISQIILDFDLLEL